jgi:branched-chain amino acid transport system substrate-binding protein
MNKHIARAAIFLFFVCGTAAAGDLVLSQIVPISGPIAPNGQGLMAGSNAYFAKVNAMGGINGNKVVLNTMDDQYKPEETLRLVQKSMAEVHPIAFMNFTGAANIELLLKVGELEKDHIALVGPRAGTQSLRNPVNPLLFHTYASYWDEVDYMVDIFASTGMTRFAVLYQDDAFGRDPYEGLKIALKKRGLELVAAESHPRGSKDITAAGQRIMKANPQAVIFSTITIAAAEFLKEYREKMPGVQFAGISAIDSATLVKLASAKLARGFVVAGNMPNPSKKSIAFVRETRSSWRNTLPASSRTSTRLAATPRPRSSPRRCDARDRSPRARNSWPRSKASRISTSAACSTPSARACAWARSSWTCSSSTPTAIRRASDPWLRRPLHVRAAPDRGRHRSSSSG